MASMASWHLASGIWHLALLLSLVYGGRARQMGLSASASQASGIANGSGRHHGFKSPYYRLPRDLFMH